MPILGFNGIGGLSGGIAASDYHYGCKFTLPVPGTVSAIHLHCQERTATPGKGLIFGIYSDVAGAPGALQAQSAPVVMPVAFAWLDGVIAVALAATDWWLTWLVDGQCEFHYQAGGANQHAIKWQAYAGGMPANFGVPAQYHAREVSIYADYTTEGGGRGHVDINTALIESILLED